MKALTLTQPWATLVAIGAKRIETRSWRTSYRGPLAIHAAKAFPRKARETCNEDPFSAELRDTTLQVGVVLATCELVGCVSTNALQENRILECDKGFRCHPFYLDDTQRQFGNYDPGRWAWLLANIHQLEAPIPFRGALSLWEWDEVK